MRGRVCHSVGMWKIHEEILYCWEGCFSDRKKLLDSHTEIFVGGLWALHEDPWKGILHHWWRQKSHIRTASWNFVIRWFKLNHLNHRNHTWQIMIGHVEHFLLDTRELKTFPRTYFGHFWNMSLFDHSKAIWVLFRKWVLSEKFLQWYSQKSFFNEGVIISFRRAGP